MPSPRTKQPKPFDTVLVANRGEIACRVLRTLRELGIRSVSVYSDADRGAKHVIEADVAVRVGPAAARSSYLDIDAVVAAALATGAQAIHPGYGFLSENADFARACAAAGLVFVGPAVHALELMGDKIRSKQQVSAHGVPVIPGVAGAGLTDQQLVEAAVAVGFPLLLKPSAGGGGKGMQVVERASELPDALAAARRIALSAFGDDALLLERFLPAPRHIEVQVLADSHGTVLHLGERECSLQRRHQKVIEEAPSPLFAGPHGAERRARIGEAACAVAASVDYLSAGTVEFLVPADAPDEFFFLEMNTRLQVEHPVTELVTGVDIVEQQLRIAAGEPLTIDQDAVVLTGHAIEARVYAEDPEHGFLPSTGTVLALAEPEGTGIRVDSSLLTGLEIPAHYDPMLAKVIAIGADRGEALARLDAALADTVVLGVHTNLEYLRLLLADPDVQTGNLDTALIERRLPSLRFRQPDAAELVVAALTLHRERWASATALWQQPTGWRTGEHRPVRYHLGADPGVRFSGTLEAAQAQEVVGSTTDIRDVFVAGTPEDAIVTIGDTVSAASIRRSGDIARVTVDRIARRWHVARDGSSVWVGRDGFACRIAVRDRHDELVESLAARDRNAGAPVSPEVRSPMPGTVVALGAATGDRVRTGQALVTVEAMKMEHRLRAPADGTVTVAVAIGDLVRLDQLVATVSTPEQPGAANP